MIIDCYVASAECGTYFLIHFVYLLPNNFIIMHFLTFQAIVFIGIASLVQAKCKLGCNNGIPITHYKEFGCESVYEKESDCCPSYYNCVKIEARAINKCYYNGQIYNKGDNIDSAQTAENCMAACFCAKNEEEDIKCAHIDCPEFFGKDEPGCYRAYKHGECCSIKLICPPFDKKNAECNVNGQIYHEGERFQAPASAGGKYLNCICKANFQGEFVEPFCKQVNCGIELTKSNALKNKCAPVYYGTDGVCPIQWQCDDENVISIQIAKERSNIDKKCSFGSKELNIGDKILLKRSSIYSPEINCECRIPPLAICIQTPYNN